MEKSKAKLKEGTIYCRKGTAIYAHVIKIMPSTIDVILYFPKKDNRSKKYSINRFYKDQFFKLFEYLGESYSTISLLFSRMS